jgi:hypothetical protein
MGAECHSHRAPVAVGNWSRQAGIHRTESCRSVTLLRNSAYQISLTFTRRRLQALQPCRDLRWGRRRAIYLSREDFRADITIRGTFLFLSLETSL